MLSSMTQQTHLARVFGACALVMQLVACSSEPDEPIDEPAGSADYFLDNQTDHALTIEWTTSAALGSQTRRAGPVAAGQRLQFEEDGIIGVNPLPVDTFASLRLEDDAGSVVYRQEPIDDDAWVVERTDDASYGHANITLVITDDLLVPGSGLPAGYCCCEFVREGDILVEDALPADECTAQPQGECITVDPDRLTPHPCCPEATGERCGDGA
jgi:hypothetical protein